MIELLIYFVDLEPAFNIENQNILDVYSIEIQILSMLH